ncbi:hydroxyacid dehydrogenase [Puniceicoccaceae bacterium K14]|nr:hydroxyacid dehydrogenase [Puniceicoccaceae bacterium K14]
MKNIIALTQIEIETFLPGNRLDEAQALLEPYKLVDPTEVESEEGWKGILKECEPEIILAAWKTPTIPEDYHESLPSLKYVCYLPGSIRKLIPRATIENGLKVTNWGGSISRTVSEMGLLLMLCCMRRVAHWQQQMHYKAGWKNQDTQTQSLFERRVGLHGFGSISQQMVPLIKPFTENISAYSPGVPDSIFEELGVKRAETLEELFSENDVIVELASLTEKNYKIVTEELLRMMPDGAAFVNVGRGLVVDEEALARVAKEKDLQVGLDVYGVEPLPDDSPFRGMPNVLLLPHLGGPTTDRRRDAGDLSIGYLKAYRETGEVEDAITLHVYDRAT